VANAAGIDMLLATLPYLDQPLVSDLSAGNRYLAARRLNIEIDLAQAYALQGNKAKAFEYLRKVVAEAQAPSLADFLGREKAFDSIRDDPKLGAILSGFHVFDRLWDSPALKTPYKENLSDAEKLAGLSKFWSEVKYNFGFPEKLVALNWDQMYLDWIPRALATKSTTDYYRELMLLCARLSDGHTNVYAPPQSDINAKPPLRTGLMEGRVVIVEVRSPTLEARGIRAGMEIVAVDGEPALDYARREVEPYQSASTPQDRENRTYWYGFLRGPSAKPPDPIQPRPGGYTSKPVVVLASAATFSAAEDFLVAWKNSGRGKIIGEPSGGSTGQPLSFTLPGGGTARVCTKKDGFPDGAEWVGKGIDPDILVHPALADVRAGRDTVLDWALAFLKSVAGN
jgi:hypothetical protein